MTGGHDLFSCSLDNAFFFVFVFFRGMGEGTVNKIVIPKKKGFLVDILGSHQGPPVEGVHAKQIQHWTVFSGEILLLIHVYLL